MERKEITTHGSNNETFLLQFRCPLVKVIVKVMICLVWGKPVKHKVQWANKCSSLGGDAQVPPLGGSFTLPGVTLWIMHSPLVEDPRNESEGALGVFNGLWPLQMT